jgi:hypothetical protein
MAESGKRGPKKGAIYRTKNAELKLDLLATLRAKGFDPAASLVEIHLEARKQYENRLRKSASGFGAASFLGIANESAKHLMEFVYPKLKSVELTGQDGRDFFQSFSEIAEKVLAQKDEHQ